MNGISSSQHPPWLHGRPRSNVPEVPLSFRAQSDINNCCGQDSIVVRDKWQDGSQSRKVAHVSAALSPRSLKYDCPAPHSPSTAAPQLVYSCQYTTIGLKILSTDPLGYLQTLAKHAEVVCFPPDHMANTSQVTINIHHGQSRYSVGHGPAAAAVQAAF